MTIEGLVMRLEKIRPGEVLPEYMQRTIFKHSEPFGKFFKENLVKGDDLEEVMIRYRRYVAEKISDKNCDPSVMMSSAIYAAGSHVTNNMEPPVTYDGKKASYVFSQIANGVFGDLLVYQMDKLRAAIHFCTNAWESAGSHVYEVERSLSRYLRHTKLHGLNGSDLHLPFPAIYIKAPMNDQGIFIPKGFSKLGQPNLIRIDGAFVIEREYRDPVRHGRAWQVVAVTDSNMASDHDGTRECLPYTVWMDDDKSPDEAINEILGLSTLDKKDPVRNSAFDLFYFIMNVVLYATNVEGATILGIPTATQELEDKKKAAKSDRRKKIERRLVGACRNRRIIVRDLNTDRTDDDFPEPTDEDPAEGKRTISVRTLVTGHWRKQACGPRHTERRLTWIRPFWRGPDGAPWIHHSRRNIEANTLRAQAN
jgi:hypothetical protein